MQAYKCLVFNYDYTHGANKKQSGWPTTELDPLDEVAVRNRTERDSAAEAYVLSCGIGRAHYLRYELNAPSPVILFEIDIAAIARELREGECWAGRCYYLDNGFEIFYIVPKHFEA